MDSGNQEMMEATYLYVHGFEWASDEDTLMFEGHLKVGRVYKAEIEIMEDGAKLYKIDLFENKRESGVALFELQGDFPKWSCDIEEIDDDGLLELDIHPDDMEMISNNDSHIQASTEVTKKEKMGALVHRTGKNMIDIVKADEDVFKTVALMIDTVRENLYADNYVSFTDALGMRQDDTGRMTNMLKSALLLEQHLNSENNNPAYLMEAVFTILLEIKRTIEIK